MSDNSFYVVEIKIGLAFEIILILGVMAVILYVAQDRWKKQNVNYNKDNFAKIMEHVCLGNKYMCVIGLLILLLLTIFFIASYEAYVFYHNCLIAICSGLSLLALKEYFKIYEEEKIGKRIRFVLICLIVLVAIELLFYVQDWKDNPYHSLTIGFLVWLISIFIEKWNKHSMGT